MAPCVKYRQKQKCITC